METWLDKGKGFELLGAVNWESEYVRKLMKNKGYFSNMSLFLKANFPSLVLTVVFLLLVQGKEGGYIHNEKPMPCFGAKNGKAESSSWVCFFSLPSAQIIVMTKWRIFGGQILIPFTSNSQISESVKKNVSACWFSVLWCVVYVWPPLSSGSLPILAKRFVFFVFVFGKEV